MSEDEARSFLSEGTRTGKLATGRRDGAPHVAPIWFVLDDDGSVVFSTAGDTVKAKAMRRDPRVSICVDLEEAPYSYVRVDGIATISHDLDEMLEWTTRIAGRYMGADRAQEYGRRNAVPSEVLVRVTPTKIVALADISA